MNKIKIFLVASILIILFLLFGAAFETFALIWIWFGIIVSLTIFFTPIDEAIDKMTIAEKLMFAPDKTYVLTLPKIAIVVVILLTGHLVTAICYTIASLFIAAYRKVIQNRLAELGELV